MTRTHRPLTWLPLLLLLTTLAACEGPPGEPGVSADTSAVSNSIVSDEAFRSQIVEDLYARYGEELRGPQGEQGPAPDPEEVAELLKSDPTFRSDVAKLLLEDDEFVASLGQDAGLQAGVAAQPSAREAIAQILVDNHAEALRGAQGEPGQDGMQGMDGMSPAPADVAMQLQENEDFVEAVRLGLVENHAEALQGPMGAQGEQGPPGREPTLAEINNAVAAQLDEVDQVDAIIAALMGSDDFRNNVATNLATNHANELYAYLTQLDNFRTDLVGLLSDDLDFLALVAGRLSTEPAVRQGVQQELADSSSFQNELANILATNHTDALRGLQGEPGPAGADGQDGVVDVDAAVASLMNNEEFFNMVASTLATNHAADLQGPPGPPGPAGEAGADGVANPEAVASLLALNEDFIGMLAGRVGVDLVGGNNAGCRYEPFSQCPGLNVDGLYLEGEINLSYSNFVGAQLPEAWFYGTNMRGLDLSEANLVDSLFAGGDEPIQLSGTDFRHADLSRATIETARMKLVNLDDATLNNAQILDTTLVDVDAAESDWINVRMSGGYLAHSRLQGADLTGITFENTKLVNVDFTGATIEGYTSTNTVWAHCICPDGTNSSDNGYSCGGHMNTQPITLPEGCNLGPWAECEGFEAPEAFDMRYAQLWSGNLRNATLTDVDLRDTDLSGVDLTGANLTNANLEGAIIDDETRFGAITWNNTTCPDGTNSNDHRNSCGGHMRNESWNCDPYVAGDCSGVTLPRDLRWANLSEADLTEAVTSLYSDQLWEGANLTGANLENLVATHNQLPDLKDVIWTGATCPDGRAVTIERPSCAGHMVDDTVSQCDISVTGSRLCANANLAGHNLAYADLSNAILTGADLRGTNLTGANLTNAILRDALLDNETIFSSTTFTGAVCPNGNTVSKPPIL